MAQGKQVFRCAIKCTVLTGARQGGKNENEIELQSILYEAFFTVSFGADGRRGVAWRFW
jgi:hypothetical protein